MSPAFVAPGFLFICGIGLPVLYHYKKKIDAKHLAGNLSHLAPGRLGAIPEQA
jgi:hypothetical protein